MEVQVHLHGGPADGKHIKYCTPLPKTLVVPHVKSIEGGIAWFDYRHVGANDYNYVGEEKK